MEPITAKVERKPSRRAKRQKRIAGIGTDARALGVSRVWLGAVLHGRGTSAPLLAKYRALKKEGTK